jgi:chitinase
LIWSVDQDTPDLKALSAVLAPKLPNVFAAKSGDQSHWKESTAQDCYVTDCGGSCKPGFMGVTKQPCGGARILTRHSTEADSTLCCPLDSAPDTKKCTWRGQASECNGQCLPGEVTLQLNRWGNGKYCEHGNKAYCCEVPAAKDTGCYWTGSGSKCNSGDTALVGSGRLAVW